jgi:hypothetical protein
MFCQWISFVPSFLSVFALIKVSTGFSVIWRKNARKTHDEPYVAIPTTNHLGDGSFMMHFWWLMTDFVSCFLTVFGQLFWFLWAVLSFRRTNAPQNTCWVIFTLPNTKNTPRWIFFMFLQLLNFYPCFLVVFVLIVVSTGISVIWRGKSPPSTYWEGQFSCTSSN